LGDAGRGEGAEQIDLTIGGSGGGKYLPEPATGRRQSRSNRMRALDQYGVGGRSPLAGKQCARSSDVGVVGRVDQT
jgi:hypothetical protein